MIELPVLGNPGNEVCECGALRTEHENRVFVIKMVVRKQLQDVLHSELYAGPCARTNCKQFTWVRFINPPSEEP